MRKRTATINWRDGTTSYVVDYVSSEQEDNMKIFYKCDPELTVDMINTLEVKRITTEYS